MKKLLFILSLVLIFSCEPKDSRNADDTEDKPLELPPCISSTYPIAPYASPDDKTTYVSDDYRTITYTWYCRSGKYISITYTQVESCAAWDKSEYTSDGICK